MLNYLNLPPEVAQSILEDYTASDFREALSQISFLLLSSGQEIELQPFSGPMFLLGKLYHLMMAIEAEDALDGCAGHHPGKAG